MGPAAGLANTEGKLAFNEINAIKAETGVVKSEVKILKAEDNANVNPSNSGNLAKQRNAPQQTGIPNSSKIEAKDPTGRTTKYSTYGSDGNLKKQVQVDKGINRHGLSGATKKVPIYNTNPSTGERFMNGYKIKKAMPAETPGGGY